MHHRKTPNDLKIVGGLLSFFLQFLFIGSNHIFVPEDEQLYSFLMSFGSKIKVIALLEVRKELLRRQQEAVTLLLEDDGRKIEDDGTI